ncbi:hypothetical protein [Raoultella planticola]|uniref:hypothetical protein n=1 Tax=Raoultella planticola TaxID=575 RepID=UPI0025A7F95B|nr:hypothetical protein [Raoultella planticola]HEC2593061.1 hypothetical protein [Raoultella planticola]
MTKSTITRERLEKIKSWRETYGAGSNVMLPAEEAEELARMALAAIDSEPVADVVAWSHPNEERKCDIRWRRHDVEPGPLYRHAQPASELKPVGYLFVSGQGAIAYSPTDWGMPGFKLAGQIFGDIDVESQPAPVVPEEKPIPNTLSMYAVDAVAAIAEVKGWNACRAAMLQAGYAVRDLSTPVDPQVAEYEQNVMQAGNSPVIPDGYVMVPKEPTAEMIAAAMNCDDVLFNSDESFCVQFGNIYETMLAAAPQEVR